MRTVIYLVSTLVAFFAAAVNADTFYPRDQAEGTWNVDLIGYEIDKKCPKYCNQDCRNTKIVSENAGVGYKYGARLAKVMSGECVKTDPNFKGCICRLFNDEQCQQVYTCPQVTDDSGKTCTPLAEIAIDPRDGYPCDCPQDCESSGSDPTLSGRQLSNTNILNSNGRVPRKGLLTNGIAHNLDNTVAPNKKPDDRTRIYNKCDPTNPKCK